MDRLPTILTTAQLAAETGLSRVTIFRKSRNEPEWALCLIPDKGRILLWSVQRLRDAGILTAPEPTAAKG